MSKWKTIKLGELSAFQGGSQPPKSEFIYEPREGYIRFLQIRDYSSDKNKTYIPQSKKNRLCNEDDVSIGRYGASVGKILTGKAGAYNVAIIKTLPNEDIVLKKYLYYFLRSEYFQENLKQVASRAAQAGFNKNDIYDFPVPIPHPDEPERSLAEQRRIVARIEALLGEVREMRALHEQITADTGRLMEAVLHGTFDEANVSKWDNSKPLSKLAEITAKMVNPTEFPFADMSHIYGKSIESGTGRMLDYHLAKEDGVTSSKFYFKSGAVLYSKIRPYLKKVTIADFDALCSADMYPLRVKSEEITSDFLMWTLLSPQFTKYANELSGRARMPKLNRDQLFSYQMAYPSIDRQKQISSKIKAVQNEIFEMQDISREDSSLIDQLEQSILAQAFKGEL